MCGIAGIINFNGQPASQGLLEGMILKMRHRGPDDQGFFADGSVGLGHCRLSIIDLSPAGHQPMPDASGTLWIVFNGEIYNYLELKKELIAKGHRFVSNSDTEVILAAYREWGQDCLNRFNGMWAFAIYDKNKKQIFCARDRFGVKPFYYYADGERFAFSSEIKGLLALEFVPRRANLEAIYNYLTYGFENYSQNTFFDGIKELPAGHFLTVDISDKKPSFKLEKWYHLPTNSGKNAGRREDYVEQFLELIRDSVSIRLRSDVTVGSCLSGGLDSSTVVCLANSILKSQGLARQEVFTSCMPGQKIDESGYAQQVIDWTGCVGNFVYPEIEGLKKNLDKIIWHQEEPFGGLGSYAQWLIMSTARQKNVKVLLDGQGGDELFLGYEQYYIPFLAQLAAQKKYLTLSKEFFNAPRNSRLSYSELVQYAVYFGFPAVRKIRQKERMKKLLKEEFAAQARECRPPIETLPLAKLQLREIFSTKIPHLVRYEDRNSMAHSIETRLPFLDYRLVEFALDLPADLKIRNGWTKYIIRLAMERKMPDTIRWRKNKIGFEVNERDFLTGLGSEIKKAFGSGALCKEIINVENFLEKYSRKEIPRQILWRIYNLELWMRQFNVGK